MRTCSWYALQEIRKRRKTSVALALVVERARSQELKLGSVVGVDVDLKVIELDGAKRLVGRKAMQGGAAKTAIAAMLLVFVEPRRNRRGRDGSMRLLFQSRGGLR